MARFVIAPHMRLHEWVAEEKGYFKDEKLDYEFHDELTSNKRTKHDLGDRVGAYQTFEKGRSSDISCACHWTVNVGASNGHGKLFADAYSVSPAGIFVPPESPVRDPAERIVFEPYTRDVFEESFEWIAEHRIFPGGGMGPDRYEDAV